MEEDRTALYFSTQNSRVYHERELMGIEISENVCFVMYCYTSWLTSFNITQDAPAIEHLIQSYPDFVTIDSLPVEEGTPDDKVTSAFIT